MYSVSLAFAVALVIAWLLVPWVRQRASNWGAVDDSARARKVHEGLIPRMGGLAIATGFFAALLFLLAVETSVAQLFASDIKRIAGVFGGGVLVLALGIYDDLRGADAKKKLLVQTIAALMLCALGFTFTHIAVPWGVNVEIGLWGIPLTVVWVVGITNAVNLIDGLDGLAAGVSLFALVTMTAVGFVTGNMVGCLLTATLAGAVAGFLFHNYHPATIFMGDTGSLFIGFVVAATGLMTSTKSSTTVALLVPVLALGLPVMDTVLAAARRVLRGRSPFSPDKEHIHHRLLQLGLTHRRAVLHMWGFCVVACLTGLATTWANGTTLVWILLLFGAFAFLFGRRLGYVSWSYWAVHFEEGRASRRSLADRKAAMRQFLQELQYADNAEVMVELLGGVHALQDYDAAWLDVYRAPKDRPRGLSSEQRDVLETFTWHRLTDDGASESADGAPLDVTFELRSPQSAHGRIRYRYLDGRRQLSIEDESLMIALHAALLPGLRRIQAEVDADHGGSRDVAEARSA